MRVAFFLLVLANLCFFAWAQGYFGGREEGREPQRLKEQIQPEKMKVVVTGQPVVAPPAPSAPTAQQQACRRIDGLAAAYPNTGYVGFPLCMIAFGPSSLTPTTIATILVVCVLFAIAIVLIETGLQSERRPHRLAIKVVRSLLRNPLLVAPALGAVVSAAHVTLPASAETFLKLLGGAASPCALVSLGLFLAERRASGAAPRESSWWLTLSKLVAQPLLTWWLADRVFGLSDQLVEIAVLLAALPTGTGPFMLAEYYRREAHVTSRTILHSTVGSLVTLTLILLHLHHG